MLEKSYRGATCRDVSTLLEQRVTLSFRPGNMRHSEGGVIFKVFNLGLEVAATFLVEENPSPSKSINDRPGFLLRGHPP